MVVHQLVLYYCQRAGLDSENTVHHVVSLSGRLAHALDGPHQGFTWDLGHLKYGRTTAGIQQRVFRWPCLPVPSQPMSAMAWGY